MVWRFSIHEGVRVGGQAGGRAGGPKGKKTFRLSVRRGPRAAAEDDCKNTTVRYYYALRHLEDRAPGMRVFCQTMIVSTALEVCII